MELEHAFCQLSPVECERMDVSRILVFTTMFVIGRFLGRAMVNCLSSDASLVLALGLAILSCVVAYSLHSDMRMDSGVFILIHTVGIVMGRLFANILQNCDSSIGFVIVRLLTKALHNYLRYKKRQPIQASLQFQTDHVQCLRVTASHVRFLQYKALYLRNLQTYFHGQQAGEDSAHQIPELHEMCLEVDAFRHEVHKSCCKLHKVCHELRQFCQSSELCNCMNLCSRLNEDEATNAFGGNSPLSACRCP